MKSKRNLKESWDYSTCIGQYLEEHSWNAAFYLVDEDDENIIIELPPTRSEAVKDLKYIFRDIPHTKFIDNTYVIPKKDWKMNGPSSYTNGLIESFEKPFSESMDNKYMFSGKLQSLKSELRNVIVKSIVDAIISFGYTTRDDGWDWTEKLSLNIEDEGDKLCLSIFIKYETPKPFRSGRWSAFSSRVEDKIKDNIKEFLREKQLSNLYSDYYFSRGIGAMYDSYEYYIDQDLDMIFTF